MSIASTSIASALRSLKAKVSDPDVYLTEIDALADIDPQSDAIDRAERIFALRERIRILQRRIQELEALK